MTAPQGFSVGPPRLVQATGLVADVLREVSNEVDSASREARAWERLEARLDDVDGGTWLPAWLPAAGAAVVAVVLLVAGLAPSGWSLPIAPEPGARLTPEPVRPTPQPAVAVPATPDSRGDHQSQREARDTPVSPEPSEPAPRRDCLAFARQGEHAKALACFEQQAGGTGMDAELAQYELGRLRRNIRGDTTGAIREYRTYLSRFPQGAFRTEASVSLAELLFASGDHRAALAESERMLSSGTARERAAELRLLRARTYQHELGDCERARAEYARLTSQAGPIGEAAKRGLAECGAVRAAERPESQDGNAPAEPDGTQTADDPAAALPVGAADGVPTGVLADER